MDGAAADSDHSLTWEDFFGSTTDLTPTLIGIYDSLLEPNKPQETNKIKHPVKKSQEESKPQKPTNKAYRPETSRLHKPDKQIPKHISELIKRHTAKDARTDPPNAYIGSAFRNDTSIKLETNSSDVFHINDTPEAQGEISDNTRINNIKDPSKLTGGVKLPIANLNNSTLYSLRTKIERSVNSDDNGANISVKSNLSVNTSVSLRTMKERKPMLDPVGVGTGHTSFENLSPNVKRMISSASDTTTSNLLKHQKKPFGIGRASTRGRSNIPLVGATSKISQSGVEILPSVEIYDQPSGSKTMNKFQNDDDYPVTIKPQFKINTEVPTNYDVPSNVQAIYDVPTNKTAFESLSLPYIDQSMELSHATNDREFDTKLKPIDTPEINEKSPQKLNTGINSLNRNIVKNEPTKQLQKAGLYPEAVGSTGDLKLCTVPEKETTRLHPPTVEVSRPLSMSSIASSSSTSSSGVQNKGGVNSAYLASIESLDDHSDADMVSASGSNNFVNSTGMLNAVPSENLPQMIRDDHACGERSGLSQLQRVCAEIVETENVYVEDLRQVVEGYLHVWRENSTFTEEELADLFNNIEEIYAFNRSLCEQLNTCQLDPTSLSRRFVDNTGGFEVYTSYCTGYPRTMARLAELATRPHSTRACRERQAALGHALPLGSYLLKPVQRILKYHLLLQNLVKQCQSRETEYALLKMTGIAQHIDDMKRKHEHAVRVQEIQSLLYGWSGPDLTTYGELCAEGTFRVFGAKAMRHAFLFDKMLLLTKNREDGILAYKSHIMCNNLMLVESIAGAPLSFHVIPWDAPRAQLTLQARSQRHKREWTLLLKRVILENYNAVIPSHARQLVMELGQNKTDDDILAEKSHNLMTHSSMRKQLSAPEYLEKRKLDRERRKTFDNNRLKKKPRKTSPTNNTQECDCEQMSAEKGTDYTCENCYVDLCSDCEVELKEKSTSTSKAVSSCNCKSPDHDEKCPECDRSLHFIDSASAEHLERKQSCCKCSDFKSSHESFGKEFSGLNITRGYHSSDNIVIYAEKGKEDDAQSKIQKTCLKCAKIKENIAITDTGSGTVHKRKSRYNELEKFRPDTLRSKSKDDQHRSKLSKISTWRRKSEPGLQENGIANVALRKSNEDKERAVDVPKGFEKIEFECRNCGSTKFTRRVRTDNRNVESDQSVERKTKKDEKPNALEVRMYNSKHVPKKIYKLKKSRAKGGRSGIDTTAKFYADISDMSTENVLHISESTESINTLLKLKTDNNDENHTKDQSIIDVDIDEETYKKLIEKTDSFKKNELEKVKYLNQQKVINEGAECESDNQNEPEKRHKEEGENESCEDAEKPLEEIISQLLMQNREFQKILKKQQLRNSAQRRHQRLLKSHSNPEAVLAARNREQYKIKPKYGRQTSENLSLSSTNEPEPISRLSPQQELDGSDDDDHIYETLRVETKIHVSNEHKPQLRSKSVAPPSKVVVHSRLSGLDSDYVYLSFDKKASIMEDNGIYDVPSSNPTPVSTKQTEHLRTDYYVPIRNQNNTSEIKNNDNIYDNILEVCRREVEAANTMSSTDYLPMSNDQHNPNNTEVWLSRQKEHFNVPSDRKSGSLPRSFQVVTSPQDETNLSTFKSKNSGSNKTYLNRDGKVLNSDRPFTIASDKCELSYDDIETYMNEDDILKFNKQSSNRNSFYDGECLESISRSTLDLEEEIDRCYKNNFEDDKNRNILTNSQQNMDISATSSCEVLMPEKMVENVQEINLVHPEHKIYKPTTNMRSLKNVLSRFKNKTPNKSHECDPSEVTSNDQNTPEGSPKADPKSPSSNEKRSALNPRSYSKNLLQRFKSIIGDEHEDNSTKHLEISAPITNEEIITSTVSTRDIKVVITSTDASPTTSTVTSQFNDLISKGVHEQAVLPNENEKNNLDALSHSCEYLKQKQSHFRPMYDKSISMITPIPSSTNSHSSPSKSNNSSYHNLNKLPMYKQGSRHLGARIAQSDYIDPHTLVLSDSKINSNNVNVLINKNALRPDSLLSTSSFVTTSSEGTYQHEHTKNTNETKTIFEEHKSEQIKISKNKEISSESPATILSDESFYEKSFEKIENIDDEELFRDSAVYSDQEDSDDMKIEDGNKAPNTPVNNSRLETMKRNKSFKLHSNIQKTEIKTNIHTRSIVTSTLLNESRKSVESNDLKPKIAPPLPTKPKLIVPSKFENCTIQSKTTKFNSLLHDSSSSIESLNNTSIKRDSAITKSINPDSIESSESVRVSESTKSETLTRSESIKSTVQVETFRTTESLPKFAIHGHVQLKKNVKPESVEINSKHLNIQTAKAISATKSKIPSNNIQMKRLTFERSSLDSITRSRSKSVATEGNQRSSSEMPTIVSKSVLERRLEIESMTKHSTKVQNQIVKPKQIVRPKTIPKSTDYARSISEPKPQQNYQGNTVISGNNLIKVVTENECATEEVFNEQDPKESWVKTIVNKFQ